MELQFSTMRSGWKSLILKYHDIELHFNRSVLHGLNLIYSDDEVEMSMTDEHGERRNLYESL